MKFELNKIYKLKTTFTEYSLFDKDIIERVTDLVVADYEQRAKEYIIEHYNEHADRDDDGVIDQRLVDNYATDAANAFRYHIDHSIVWSWKTDDNNTTLTKRLAKLAGNARYNNLKLNPSTLEKVGNLTIGDKNLKENGLLKYFDITQDFNWRAGDYGDTGSCFWKSKNAARYYLSKNPKVYAVRFYAPEEYKNDSLLKFKKNFYLLHTLDDGKKIILNGTGRAFIVFDTLEDKPFYVLFNAYGTTLPTIGEDLKLFLTEENQELFSTKKIQLQNDNNQIGTVWIGSSQDKGYDGQGLAIASKETLSKLVSYDLGIKYNKQNEVISISPSILTKLKNDKTSPTEVKTSKDLLPFEPLVIREKPNRWTMTILKEKPAPFNSFIMDKEPETETALPSMDLLFPTFQLGKDIATS